MSIHVIQNGVKPPPDEAFNCPWCGTREKGYRAIARQFNSVYSHMQCQLDGYIIQPVPTFACQKCGCIWQWEDELPTPVNESVNLEKPEDIEKIADDVVQDNVNRDMESAPDADSKSMADNRPWYKQFWDGFTLRSSRW